VEFRITDNSASTDYLKACTRESIATRQKAITQSHALIWSDALIADGRVDKRI